MKPDNTMLHQTLHNADDEAAASQGAPAIGFLTESLNSHYQSNIWIGASDTATKLGYSLFCFAGGSLGRSSWDRFEPQRNSVYDFIDKRRLRGIIIAGSLGNFVSGSEFRDFYHRFIDIPMVCLGPEIPSVPTVVVDNTHGMRQLVSHLVEVHHCRKIAFVRGPEGNQEAEERLRIFREVLGEHGLVPDPDLIFTGDFSREAGFSAARTLIDEGRTFDALAGANDDTALGALKAFQELHIRVPDEVLVVGFDDFEESRFYAPALTTVRQPLFEMGAKAIETIDKIIRGDRVGGTIVVPASLVTRQSCGCLRDVESSRPLFAGPGPGSTENDLRRHLHLEVRKAVEKLLERAIENQDEALIEEVSHTFCDEITGTRTGRFIPAIARLSWRLAASGSDIMGLYRLLPLLRRFLVAVRGGPPADQDENLLFDTSVVLAESATRAQANRRINGERRATILRKAGQAISSAFDMEHLLEVITAELVNLEIDECYLSLYRWDETASKVASDLELVLALQEGRLLKPGGGSCTLFTAPRIAPEEVFRLSEARSLLIEPLLFRDEQIGIAVFGVGRCRDGQTYEILQQHISSSLKGTLLMRKVQEQATALESANLQLQKLRDSEHAYLEAIKHELELGREIQNSFLPRTIPEAAGWEIVNSFHPAREVSGDFYDVFTLPDGKLMVIICDVSGKDVSAALFMALIRTLVRAMSEQALSAGDADPLDAVTLTNRYMINHHYGANGRYMYATLFAVLLEPASGMIRYINAGHNPAAIVSPAGGVRSWVRSTGPAIGIIPGAEFGKKSCDIASGETLFLYTDGVTDARSPDGAHFSKERLHGLLSVSASSAAELVERVDLDIKRHSGEGNPPFDDITMLAMKRVSP